MYTLKNVMTSVINDASDIGLTRIEISYIAESPEAMNEIFSNSFLENAQVDINTLEWCINKTSGICHRVPLRDLLHGFQEEAKFNQFFIRLPNTAAIIYCTNLKKGSYCGYVYDIPIRESFSTEDFLAKHALPGPDSRIRCEVMKQGPLGNIESCFYLKKTPICLIPGFKYSGEQISPIPKPVEWSSH